MQWQMQSWEAALNPPQKWWQDTVTAAGNCPNRSLQRGESCHTITLLCAQPTSYAPTVCCHVLLIPCSNLCISKQSFSDNNMKKTCKSQVESTLLLPGYQDVSGWIKKTLSICLHSKTDRAILIIAVEAHTDVRVHTFLRMHICVYTLNLHTVKNSVQGRANQLFNCLSVLIFIIRLRTYG